MYIRQARLASGLVSRATIRTYASRQSIKESPLSPQTRSFRSAGQPQEQATHATAPIYTEPYEHRVEDTLPSSSSHFPITKNGVPQQLDLPKSLYQDSLTSTKDESLMSPLSVIPLYYRGEKFDKEPYWQNIGRWRDVTEKEFLTHSWQIAKNIQGRAKLYKFLSEVVPESVPGSSSHQNPLTRSEFIEDVVQGIKEAPMSIRLTPHILASIDWNNPLTDPLRRQFIPLKSAQLPDHPQLTLDSLHETDDSPVPGLVHRYPDKVLFLATSVCGLYCRYCTRSYAVGGNTETVTKAPNKPIKSRWDDALAYIRRTTTISDVVVSGGDSYYLLPEQLRYIGDSLLSIPHIRRFRIATKGLCVSPSRTLDESDTWTRELVRLSEKGRKCGVQVALHTHFNHEREISWVTREAAQKLFESGVVVRNQSVLLRGVNDDVGTMSSLIRELADMNIQPYYVYQSDMVRGVEDLRTPLSTILHIEQHIRGSIAGFMMPSFVVDLPGGGGKRLAAGFERYDQETGRSTFKAPAVKGEAGKDGGKQGKVYEYWDPIAFTQDGGAAARMSHDEN